MYKKNTCKNKYAKIFEYLLHHNLLKVFCIHKWMIILIKYTTYMPQKKPLQK